ncbi:MAG: heparin lyase I family protein [Cyanobacteria bacterium P01_E01_bin.6]
MFATQIAGSGSGQSSNLSVIDGGNSIAPSPGSAAVDLDFTGSNGTNLTTYEGRFQTLGTFEISSNYLVATAANSTSEADAIALIDPPSSSFKLTCRVYLGTAVGFPSRVGIAFLGGALQDFYFYRIQDNQGEQRGLLRKRQTNQADALTYKLDQSFNADDWNDVVLIQRDKGNNVFQIELWINGELNLIQSFNQPSGLKCGFIFEADTVAQSIDCRIDNFKTEAYTETEIRQELEAVTLTNYENIAATNPLITGSNTTNFSYSNGRVAQLENNETTGALTTTFTGATGEYDVVVGYVAGNGGAPQARIQTTNLNQTWFFATSDSYQNKEIVWRKVALVNGETVTITGDLNGTQYPRFDYIRFLPPSTEGTPADTTRVEAETFSLTAAFVASDSAASGGASNNHVRLNNGATTGSATSTMSLPTGSYTVTFGYLQESDDNDTIDYEITINGRTESFTSGVVGAIAAASRSYLNWTINNGDTITVTMSTTNSTAVGSGVQKGRFDYIDLTVPEIPGTSSYTGEFGSAIQEGDSGDQSSGSSGGSGGTGPNPSDPNVTYDHDIPMTATYDTNIFSAQIPSVETYSPYSVASDPAGGNFDCWRFQLKNNAETEEVSSGMRSELRFNSSNLIPLNTEIWVGFAIYLDPSTYSAPYDTGTEIVGQWHEVSSVQGGPPLVNIFDNGLIESIIRGDSSNNPSPSNSSYRRVDRTFNSYGNYKVGQWMNFVFHIIFDPNDGLTECWIDNQLFYSDTGKNAYAGLNMYFKIGLCKNSWNDGKSSNTNDRILYWSSFRQARGSNLYDAVYPGL